jgi:LmbE family N-acetylglucosaminyl deacetylase
MDNLIIVAHPDDEIVWFSTLLREKNSALIICFDIFSKKNQDILDNNQRVSCILNYYKKFIPVIWLRTPKSTFPKIFGKVDKKIIKSLSINLNSIIKMLSPKRVFTHNPWGEYGHSEHKAIYKIVSSIRPDVLFPEAALDKALISKEFKLNFHKVYNVLEKETDFKFKKEIEKIYVRNNMWTMKELNGYPLKKEVFKRCSNG